jgi:hypothetical protein
MEWLATLTWPGAVAVCGICFVSAVAIWAIFR